MKWKVTRLSKNTVDVKIKYKSGEKFSFLLGSDAHIDNPKCCRDLLFSHFDEAQKRKAGIFHFGDLFCLMEGKYDPRRSRKGIRPEYNSDNYLDLVYNDIAEKLAPYAENIIALSDGNHETQVHKNVGSDPIDNLIIRLGIKGKSKIEHLPYVGFIRFTFQHEGGGNTKTKHLFFQHGKFGGIVTKGALGIIREASVAPKADFIYTGHTHDWLVHPHGQYDVKRNGEMHIKSMWYMKGGTYKDEFREGSGWATEKIFMPKAVQAGVWLNFEVSSKKIRSHVELTKC